MGFGASYSLLEVDTIEFVRTPIHKKLIRSVIGILFSAIIYLGSYFLYNWMNDGYKQDIISQFVETRALPFFIIGIFIYGPYVVICKKMGLVGESIEKVQPGVTFEDMDTKKLRDNSVDFDDHITPKISPILN